MFISIATICIIYISHFYYHLFSYNYYYSLFVLIVSFGGGR